MRCVDMVFKKFVHGKSSRANGALVRQVSWFEAQTMVFDHMTQQLPLVYLF